LPEARRQGCLRSQGFSFFRGASADDMKTPPKWHSCLLASANQTLPEAAGKMGSAARGFSIFQGVGADM